MIVTVAQCTFIYETLVTFGTLVTMWHILKDVIPRYLRVRGSIDVIRREASIAGDGGPRFRARHLPELDTRSVLRAFGEVTTTEGLAERLAVPWVGGVVYYWIHGRVQVRNDLEYLTHLCHLGWVQRRRSRSQSVDCVYKRCHMYGT